jgi:hypothetical protein
MVDASCTTLLIIVISSESGDNRNSQQLLTHITTITAGGRGHRTMRILQHSHTVLNCYVSQPL